MTGGVAGPGPSGESGTRGGLESRWKEARGGEGGGGEGKGEQKKRPLSVELVPFHGSLETIILIKLTTGPSRGYKGILRNDLPRSASRGPLNRWIPRNATRTDDKFYGSTMADRLGTRATGVAARDIPPSQVFEANSASEMAPGSSASN